jgi:hypothetical protein
MILVVIFCGILVRSKVFDYTADRLFSICLGFLAYWFDLSPFINMIHKTLFGGKISMFAQVNVLSFAPPSKSRYVEVGTGTSLSACTIDATAEERVKIGSHASVGLFANINPGVTIESSSQVATCANVPTKFTIQSYQSFFSPQCITKSTVKAELDPTIWNILSLLISKILIQWTCGILLIGGTVFVMKRIHAFIQLFILLQVPVVTFLTIVVAGVGFTLFDALLCRLIIPSPRKKSEPIRLNSRKFLASCCSMHYSFHYHVGNFVGAFCRGTVWMALFYKALGADIQHPSRVLLFGNCHDMKNLTISSSGSEKLTLNTFYFVTDRGSLFEAHRLEYGYLIFEKVASFGVVSLHPQAIVMDQTLIDITLGKKTRVFFSKTVTKGTSGFYYRVPGEECTEDGPVQMNSG